MVGFCRHPFHRTRLVPKNGRGHPTKCRDLSTTSKIRFPGRCRQSNLGLKPLPIKNPTNCLHLWGVVERPKGGSGAARVSAEARNAISNHGVVVIFGVAMERLVAHTFPLQPILYIVDQSDVHQQLGKRDGPDDPGPPPGGVLAWRFNEAPRQESTHPSSYWRHTLSWSSSTSFGNLAAREISAILAQNMNTMEIW